MARSILLTGCGAIWVLAGAAVGQTPEQVVEEYAARAWQMESRVRSSTGEEVPPLPPTFRAWWEPLASRPLEAEEKAIAFSVQELILRALEHSSRAAVYRYGPLIQRTFVAEADGEFDARGFIDSKFVRTSEPVGNLLTTGGPDRFRDADWGYELGLRKTTRSGGRFEISQQIGIQTNNSIFFVPSEQGNARLTISFTQPLWRGAGKAYNMATELIAQIEADASLYEFERRMEDFLVDVYEAYWSLYLERVAYLQRQKLLEAGEGILRELEMRQNVDVRQSQILQARARVERRRHDLVSSWRAVRNAEARIRALVNDPDFLAAESIELVPREIPSRLRVDLRLRDALVAAVENREEVEETLREIRAAAWRLKVAEQDLLPRLDAILETYVSGLADNFSVGDALGGQFLEGEPSYTVGFAFELPIHNTAARARYHRRQLEIQQMLAQFRTTMENLMAEVEIAVRNVNTSYEQVQTAYRSMEAAASELRYYQERWRLMPGDEDIASVILENLLLSQERLAQAEYAFAQSLVAYNISHIHAKRAEGILFRAEQMIQPQAQGPVPDSTPALPQGEQMR
ncbi:MAG TPA: TolC family protein [Planctomycetes bacterium]|nr:TolC family protein [Planctomycetota bacterium]